MKVTVNKYSNQSEAAKRLDMALQEARQDYASLAKYLGISKATATVWSTEDKIMNASVSKILKAAQWLSVRPEWLILGTGPMRSKSYKHEFDLKKLSHALEILDRYAKSHVKNMTYQKRAALLDLLYDMPIAELDEKMTLKLLDKIDQASKVI